MVARCAEFTTTNRLIEWLFYTTRLYYSQGFGKVHKTYNKYADAYLLPSNKVSNIITLKAKMFSPNSWYKHIAHVLENY